MLLEHVLLVLPIHKRSKDRYKADHRQYFERKTREQENPNKQWRMDRKYWKEHFSWGYWLYNDVIGWLEIGWDGANRLGGDVYLKWQYLARKVRHQVAPGAWETIPNPKLRERIFVRMRTKHEVIRDTEIWPRSVNVADNQSCTEVVRDIVSEAGRHVRERFRHAEVWLPPFGLECINWVEAISQAKEKHDRLA